MKKLSRAKIMTFSILMRALTEDWKGSRSIARIKLQIVGGKVISLGPDFKDLFDPAP